MAKRWRTAPVDVAGCPAVNVSAAAAAADEEEEVANDSLASS